MFKRKHFDIDTESVSSSNTEVPPTPRGTPYPIPKPKSTGIPSNATFVKKQLPPDLRFVTLVSGAIISRSVESLLKYETKEGNDKQEHVYYEYQPDFLFACNTVIENIKNVIYQSHNWYTDSNDKILEDLQGNESVTIALAACVARALSNSTKILTTSFHTRHQLRDSNDVDSSLNLKLVLAIDKAFPNTVNADILRNVT